MFLSRSAKRPSKRDTFFNETRLNRDTMDSMVKDVVEVVGLDVEDRKITNLSLRVTAMNVQELLGFSEDTTARHAGHSSTKTQRTYKRTDLDRIALVGGATASSTDRCARVCS